MIIAVDWDGVIHDRANPQEGGKFGPPIDGAREAMWDLYEAGHGLIVHTVMAKTFAGRQAVREWMRYFNIPFDDVDDVKPDADVFIDDKAIRFTTWPETLEKLGELSGQSS